MGLSKNEKRIIRRKAEKFSLETGELLYTKKDKAKVAIHKFKILPSSSIELISNS